MVIYEVLNMAFKRLAPEVGNVKYWTPKNIGEEIEGNICDEETDNYGNRRIVLDRGVDNEGNEIKTTLPGHYGLQQYYNKVKNGDYIRVTLIDIKEAKNGNNKLNVYKVEIDDERFKNY